MTGPAELLRSLEGRARKRFGQHFLASPGIVRRIVQEAQVEPGARVLEIGPGLGVLTEALEQAGADLVAVELDRDLIGFLADRLPSVQLVQGDAADMDWDEVLTGGDWQVVSNLPYNVGTRIVNQLLARPHQFRRLTVMVQREVAERMVAPVGHRKRGSLSVYVQARATARIAIRVPPGAFHPPPKVRSAVVDLKLHEAPRIGQVPTGHFDHVVRCAFSAPRKTIRNTLRTGFDGSVVDKVLEQTGIEPSLRPAELDLAVFERLASGLPVG